MNKIIMIMSLVFVMNINAKEYTSNQSKNLLLGRYIDTLKINLYGTNTIVVKDCLIKDSVEWDDNCKKLFVKIMNIDKEISVESKKYHNLIPSICKDGLEMKSLVIHNLMRLSDYIGKSLTMDTINFTIGKIKEYDNYVVIYGKRNLKNNDILAYNQFILELGKIDNDMFCIKKVETEILTREDYLKELN